MLLTQLGFLKNTEPPNRCWLSSKVADGVYKVTSWSQNLQTLAGGHMLTSTLSSSFSSCGCGRAWPTALLWLRLGKLGCQSQASTPVSTVLAGCCVRCTGNPGLAYKCRDIIATDDKGGKKEEEGINDDFFFVSVINYNRQKMHNHLITNLKEHHNTKKVLALWNI